MQSWGDGSRFQLRRTADAPTKSGVLGLILCASGTRRSESDSDISELRKLRFGVRIDRPGTRGWDYHSAGAEYGILSAENKVKITSATGDPETLLSRREYLFDASFVVGLEGTAAQVHLIADCLKDPKWTVFLGRKCCVPTVPVLECVLDGSGLLEALAVPPCHSGRIRHPPEGLRVLLDAPIGEPLPDSARIAYDLPRALGVMEHDPRWVIETSLQLPTVRSGPLDGESSESEDRRDGWWRQVRRARLDHDHALCVFCKSEAEEVHHVTYERRGAEMIEDLRSLCRVCHDACTALEYGAGLKVNRIDPCDPAWRGRITDQIDRARLAGAAAVRQRVHEALASTGVYTTTIQRGVQDDVSVVPND